MARIRFPACRKSTIPPHVRRAVAARYGGKPGETIKVQCAYCDAVGLVAWFLSRNEKKGWVSLLDLEFDHTEPEALGGETSAENLVLACRHCNRSKGSKTRESWRGD